MDTAIEIPQGYVQDAKGRLVPEELVKPQDQLINQTVDEIFKYADELSAQIGRFKGHTFSDIAECMDLLAENYGKKVGGEKGNVTLTSFDGCRKVIVQVHDFMDFGPELQIAKGLYDECISAWSAKADDRVKILIDHAFQVDKKGQINRQALFSLRRLDMSDSLWDRASAALSDSIRFLGSKEYIRFYKRSSPRDRWVAVPIDLASAVAPAVEAPKEYLDE